MSDGTQDRGPKPPRTLFSLGRPGAGPAPGADDTSDADLEAPVEAADTGVAAEVATDHPDAPVETDDAVADEELQYDLLCGACNAPLIDGAAFCGECGTPVAVEGVDYDAEPAADDPAAFAPEVEPAPFVPEVEGAAPAAVLYADPSQAEPLPPEPEGSWGIAAPVFGGADGGDEVDGSGESGEPQPAADEHGLGAAAAVGGVAAGAVIGDAIAHDAPAATAEEAIGEPAGATDAGYAGSGDAGATDAGYAEPGYVDPAATGEAAGAPTESGWADTAGADAGAPADGAVDADTGTGGWGVAPAAAVGGAVVGAGVAGAATAGSADAVGAAAPPPGAPGAPGAPGGPAGTALPYGTGPVESSSGGSKTGLLIGLGAAAVVLLVIGAIVLLASGNKGGDVQTAQTPTTQAAASGPADTKKAGTSTTSTRSDASTTSTAPATDTTAAPTTEAPTTVVTTIVAPTTVITVAPTRPTVTVPPTAPPAQPGRNVPNPGGGSTVNVQKGGQFPIVIQNVGGSPASCSLSASSKLSIVSNCSPSVPAGGSVTVIVRANIEGSNESVYGAMEGVGSYKIIVNVTNA